MPWLLWLVMSNIPKMGRSDFHRLLPVEDFVKLFRHEGKVLRFKAKFANPKPEATGHHWAESGEGNLLACQLGP